MQEDTSFQGDVIGLCISIKGRHTEGKGRHQRGLSLLKPYYSLVKKNRQKAVLTGLPIFLGKGVAGDLGHQACR